MNFLLTNDDGIQAEGIATLIQAVNPLGKCLVVAPAQPQSGCSQRVTVDQPVLLEQRDANKYAIHGTPADCVRVAIHHFPNDWNFVLSGINHGGNLGTDIYYSGTVAAVREAMLHGFPGIAFSLYRRKHREFDWKRILPWVQQVFEQILQRSNGKPVFWNVNFPCLNESDPEPAIIFCPHDSSPLPLNYHSNESHFTYNGDYHNRQRIANADVDICFRGNIAVTCFDTNSII